MHSPGGSRVVAGDPSRSSTNTPDPYLHPRARNNFHASTTSLQSVPPAYEAEIPEDSTAAAPVQSPDVQVEPSVTAPLPFVLPSSRVTASPRHQSTSTLIPPVTPELRRGSERLRSYTPPPMLRSESSSSNNARSPLANSPITPLSSASSYGPMTPITPVHIRANSSGKLAVESRPQICSTTTVEASPGHTLQVPKSYIRRYTSGPLVAEPESEEDNVLSTFPEDIASTLPTPPSSPPFSSTLSATRRNSILRWDAQTRYGPPSHRNTLAPDAQSLSGSNSSGSASVGGKSIFLKDFVGA